MSCYSHNASVLNWNCKNQNQCRNWIIWGINKSENWFKTNN